MLLENDEVTQKIEIYKKSNHNVELNNNLAQLQRYLKSMEEDLAKKRVV